MAGNFPYVRMNVTEKFAINPGHTHIKHRRTGLHHISGQHMPLTCGSNNDIGSSGFGLQILRTGMAQRHRGVFRLTGEHKTNRPPHGHTPTNNHNLFTRGLHTKAFQQVNGTVRGAGQWGWFIQNQFAQVYRVQTIGVFSRINALQHSILVEMPRQWQLNNVTGTCGISIELINDGV